MRTADRLLNTFSTRRLQPQLALIVFAMVAIAGLTVLESTTAAGAEPVSRR